MNQKVEVNIFKSLTIYLITAELLRQEVKMKEKILEAIREVRKISKKRNFDQTFDLIINLKDIDVKKPENRINEIVKLPHGLGREVKVILFSDYAKDVGCEVMGSEEIVKLGKNKREAKKLARKTDFFVAEPRLMPVIGKNLGMYLGPRNKMPVIASGDIKEIIENLKKSVRIRIKDSPVIQCAVGKESMEDEKIAENIEEIIKFLSEKLPRGKNNIKEVLIKLTMSPPVKVEVGR